MRTVDDYLSRRAKGLLADPSAVVTHEDGGAWTLTRDGAEPLGLGRDFQGARKSLAVLTANAPRSALVSVRAALDWMAREAVPSLLRAADIHHDIAVQIEGADPLTTAVDVVAAAGALTDLARGLDSRLRATQSTAVDVPRDAWHAATAAARDHREAAERALAPLAAAIARHPGRGAALKDLEEALFGVVGKIVEADAFALGVEAAEAGRQHALRFVRAAISRARGFQGDPAVEALRAAGLKRHRIRTPQQAEAHETMLWQEKASVLIAEACTDPRSDNGDDPADNPAIIHAAILWAASGAVPDVESVNDDGRQDWRRAGLPAVKRLARSWARRAAGGASPSGAGRAPNLAASWAHSPVPRLVHALDREAGKEVVNAD